MCNGKKLLSAVLAAFICFSSVNFTSFPVFAASDDDEKIEYTFDGEYLMSETADGEFDSSNDEEVEKALEKRLLSALGKRSVEVVTYADLAKVTSLNLSNLNLTELPSCINYMVNLRTLNLSNNRLQNSGLSNINLIGCTKLTNINLSKNYLNRVPSWFINSRVTTRNVSENFIQGENPRSIKVLTDEYYFVSGEPFDEGNLKTRILDSVRFNDDSLLPDFLYDYDDPPYKNNESYDTTHPYPYELDFAGWDFKKYIDEDGNTKVDADGFVDVTICLFKDTASDNTKATVRVFLLDGKSASSIRQRLEQLLKECDTIKGKKSDYTEASWNRLDAAQQTAAAIKDYNDSDMEMLSNALSVLSHAMNGLEKAASTFKSTLDALVKVGGTYKEADYSPASWEVFKNALDELKALQSDKNATSGQAQRAIKAFQKAQSNLAYSALKIPETVPKADFEQIYGESISRTYSGTTLDEKDYTWTFLGTDITAPADFKPEVQNTHAASADIMIEVGNSSGFRLFSTVQTGAFPGKGTLSLELDSFANGSYYLYKWDTSAKNGKMKGKATVENNRLTVSLDEGGVYYIGRNIRNFDLKSTRFKIDDAGKSIILPLLGEYKASDLKNSMEYGTYVEISDENGDLVSNVSVLYDGMTVNAPGGTKYTIKKSGDINSDNNFNLGDISALLNIVVNNLSSDLGDVNGDGEINLDDVNALLEYFVNG